MSAIGHGYVPGSARDSLFLLVHGFPLCWLGWLDGKKRAEGWSGCCRNGARKRSANQARDRIRSAQRRRCAITTIIPSYLSPRESDAAQANTSMRAVRSRRGEGPG